MEGKGFPPFIGARILNERSRWKETRRSWTN